MRDDYGLAKSIFGSREAKRTGATYTYAATALTDSADGYVTVSMDGESAPAPRREAWSDTVTSFPYLLPIDPVPDSLTVNGTPVNPDGRTVEFSGEGEEFLVECEYETYDGGITIPTSPTVRKGQLVQVTVVDGRAMVTAVIGEGDSIRDSIGEVADAAEEANTAAADAQQAADDLQAHVNEVMEQVDEDIATAEQHAQDAADLAQAAQDAADALEAELETVSTAAADAQTYAEGVAGDLAALESEVNANVQALEDELDAARIAIDADAASFSEAAAAIKALADGADQDATRAVGVINAIEAQLGKNDSNIAAALKDVSDYANDANAKLNDLNGTVWAAIADADSDAADAAAEADRAMKILRQAEDELDDVSDKAIAHALAVTQSNAANASQAVDAAKGTHGSLADRIAADELALANEKDPTVTGSLAEGLAQAQSDAEAAQGYAEGVRNYLDGVASTLNNAKAWYAESSTGATTAAKVATITPTAQSWQLSDGVVVIVEFSKKLDVNSPTLNVNSTGAKPIKDVNGTALTKTGAAAWAAGEAVPFVYDATNQCWVARASAFQVNANTRIEQNADAITLTAYRDLVNAGRNISPFFEADWPTSGTSTEEYWAVLTKSCIENTVNDKRLTDGWAKVTLNNASGSDMLYAYFAPKPDDALPSSGTFTMLVEVKGLSKTGSANPTVYAAGASGTGVPQVSGAASDAISQDGEIRRKLTLTGESSPTRFVRARFAIQAGSSATFYARVSVYQDVEDSSGNRVGYTGPWKPYSGGLVYSTHAELSVTAGEIKSEVYEHYEGGSDTTGVLDSYSTVSQTAADISSSVTALYKSQYGDCTTAKDEAAKTVTCESFPSGLTKGMTIAVRFRYGNEAASPTLNVNGTGAKPILVNGSSTPAATKVAWAAYTTCSFTYDGSYWRYTGSDEVSRQGERLTTAETNISQTADSITSLASMQDTYTKPNGTTGTNPIKGAVDAEADKRKAHYGNCTTAADQAAKTVSCSNFELYEGATIAVRFQNGNTAASPTLNVNSTGAKSVLVNGSTTPAADKVKWSAFATCYFVYDGTRWRFISSDEDIKRVINAESRIEQTAQSITSLVSMNETYTNPSGDTVTNTIRSTVTQTAEAIETQFHDFLASGANMLMDTNVDTYDAVSAPYPRGHDTRTGVTTEFVTMQNSPVAGLKYAHRWTITADAATGWMAYAFYNRKAPDEGQSNGYQHGFRLMNGEKYTISCWVYGSSGNKAKGRLRIYSNTDDGAASSATVVSYQFDVKYGWNFVRASGECVETRNYRAIFDVNPQGQAVNVSMCGFSLMQGVPANEYDTMIRESNLGIEVGKVDSSGSYVGARSLVSPQGAFQVLEADGTAMAEMTGTRMQIGKDASNNVVVNTDGVYMRDGSRILTQFLPTSVRVGPTVDANGNDHPNIYINGTSGLITIRKGTSLYSQFADTYARIGSSSMYHIIAGADGNASGIFLKDGSGNVLSQLTSSVMTIGRVASGYKHLTASADGIYLYDGTESAANRLAAFDSSSVTVGKTGGIHTIMSSDGFAVKSGSTSLGLWNGTSIRIGKTDNAHIFLGAPTGGSAGIHLYGYSSNNEIENAFISSSSIVLGRTDRQHLGISSTGLYLYDATPSGGSDSSDAGGNVLGYFTASAVRIGTRKADAFSAYITKGDENESSAFQIRKTVYNSSNNTWNYQTFTTIGAETMRIGRLATGCFNVTIDASEEGAGIFLQRNTTPYVSLVVDPDSSSVSKLVLGKSGSPRTVITTSEIGFVDGSGNSIGTWNGTSIRLGKANNAHITLGTVNQVAGIHLQGYLNNTEYENATITSTSITLGRLDHGHLVTNANGLYIYDESSVCKASFTSSGAQLGADNGKNVLVSSTGVQLRDYANSASVVTGQFAASGIVLGQSNADHMNLTSSSLAWYKGGFGSATESANNRFLYFNTGTQTSTEGGTTYTYSNAAARIGCRYRAKYNGDTFVEYTDDGPNILMNITSSEPTLSMLIGSTTYTMISATKARIGRHSNGYYNLLIDASTNGAGVFLNKSTGTGASDFTTLASFKDTAITMGKSNDVHSVIEPGAYSIVDGSGYVRGIWKSQGARIGRAAGYHVLAGYLDESSGDIAASNSGTGITGGIFIMNSDAVRASLTSAGMTIGLASDDHAVFNNYGMFMYDGSEDSSKSGSGRADDAACTAYFASTAARIGKNSGSNMNLTADQLQFRKNGTVYSYFGADAAQIGRNTGSLGNVFIGALNSTQGVYLRNGTTVMASITGSAVTVGQSTGKNVAITSSSVDICSSSTVWARFASSKIELGRNLATSVIEMCNGMGKIAYRTESSHTHLTGSAVRLIGVNGAAIEWDADGTSSDQKKEQYAVFSASYGTSNSDRFGEATLQAGDKNSYACVQAKGAQYSGSSIIEDAHVYVYSYGKEGDLVDWVVAEYSTQTSSGDTATSVLVRDWASGYREVVRTTYGSYAIKTAYGNIYTKSSIATVSFTSNGIWNGCVFDRIEGAVVNIYPADGLGVVGASIEAISLNNTYGSESLSITFWPWAAVAMDSKRYRYVVRIWGSWKVRSMAN